MNRIKKLLVVGAMVGALFTGTQGIADAAGNTIEIRVSNYWSNISSTIYIYGPNGYYRSAYVGKGQDQRNYFGGAPCCDYRLRVRFSNGKELNLYGNIFSRSSGQHACRGFTAEMGTYKC